MKKICVIIILCCLSLSLYSISTVMNHRLTTSSPLLYKQNDYTFENLSIEIEPFISGSFDPDHTIAQLTPNGSMNLSLNQEGNGNINPAWLYLGSKNTTLDYASIVSLNPEQQLYGLLFHWYQQYKHFFFDMRTALMQSKSIVTLNEVGGGNGGLSNNLGVIIYDAYDAFTQNSYQYGKIGELQQLIGFDNIQVMLGATGEVSTNKNARSQLFLAGFSLLEVPTGAGTKAAWLFEPQLGSNHWAFGFGFDGMLVGNHGYSFVVGGNFRHYIANWETRTFDLTNNGPWSRYLLVEPLSTLDGSLSVGMPGINIFTQPALIAGRNEINFYSRLKKSFGGSYLELSYNLAYKEAESIRTVTGIPSGYGIYALGTNGGSSTSSTAQINQVNPVVDNTITQLTTSDLNLSSGAADQWMSNTIAVRLQRTCDIYTYGFGATVDLARTAQAISSWAVWFDFEYLFDYTHNND